jgi:Holliday junction resolvase RusA-like endonuclease
LNEYNIIFAANQFLSIMANIKVLDDIRKEMSKLEKEYKALTEAYNLIASSAGQPAAPKSNLSAALSKVSAAPKAPAAKAKKVAQAKKEVKPKKAAKAVKPIKVKAPAKAPVKAALKVVAKKAPKKAVKKSAAKGEKRGRVGNLSSLIQDTISKAGRYMTNAQITDKIVSKYPGKDRSDLGKYISVILAIMKGKKLLACVTVDSQGNRMRSGLWGLPGWFDGAKPKSEYMK